MKNKRIMGAALGVCLLGVIIAAYAMNQKSSSSQSDKNTPDKLTHTTNGEEPDNEYSNPETPDTGTGLTMTDVDLTESDDNAYTVTFYNEDGDIVDQQRVPEGGSARPAGNGYSDAIGRDLPKSVADPSEAPVTTPSVQKPALTREDNRFVGWDTKLDNITCDTEVRPVTEKKETDGTEVYGDAVYVKQGENTAFSLELGSNAAIAVLQLIVKTDTSKLVYQGCQNLDTGVRVAQKEDEIRISFLSNTNIDGSLYLGDLVFAAIGDAGTDAEILVEVDKAVRVDENEELVNTDVSVANGIVHIY